MQATDHGPTLQLLRWFRSDHLPEHLAIVSQIFEGNAWMLAQSLPASAELTVSLRKLLEAKDAAVRATIDANEVDVITQKASGGRLVVPRDVLAAEAADIATTSQEGEETRREPTVGELGLCGGEDNVSDPADSWP